MSWEYRVSELLQYKWKERKGEEVWSDLTGKRCGRFYSMPIYS